MSKEIMQQCLDLITELDKAGVVCELGLILELRNALGIPDKLKMKAELVKTKQDAGKCGCGANLYIDENGNPCSKAQPEHPLDKKATNARELGIDYEPDAVQLKEKKMKNSEEVQITPKHEWVGLTDDEISEVLGSDIYQEQSGELNFI
jgi:hypothetical protein